MLVIFHIWKPIWTPAFLSVTFLFLQMASSYVLRYFILSFWERVGALSWRILLKTAPLAYCTSQSCVHPQSVISSHLSGGGRTAWQMGGVLESQSPSLRSIRLWSGTPTVEWTADTYRTVHFKASFHQETTQSLWDSTIQYVDIHHSDYKLKRTGKKKTFFFCKQTQHFKASCVCSWNKFYSKSYAFELFSRYPILAKLWYAFQAKLCQFY